MTHQQSVSDKGLCGLGYAHITHAETCAVELEQEFAILFPSCQSPSFVSRWTQLGDSLGSGTSTSCTSTLKSGPSLTTTPARPLAGICTSVMVCEGGSAGIERSGAFCFSKDLLRWADTPSSPGRGLQSGLQHFPRNECLLNTAVFH